jgi:ribose transport system ATP-binding protein
VAKRYGHTQALDGADLALMPAEILGLIGHNGAGKSTLMRVVTGLARRDGGELEVCGRVVGADYDLAAARALGIRIAFQELSLSPTLAVFENVLVSRPALRGRGWQHRSRSLISRELDLVFPGHGIPVRSRIGRLSLAQRQMLEIAQATVNEDGELTLLILDEPTSALGRDSADNLFRHLDRLKQQGVSTILISHKMAEILTATDRTVVMRDGRVVAQKPTAQFDAESVIAVMGAVGTAAGAPSAVPQRSAVRGDAAAAPVRVRASGLSTDRLHDVRLEVRAGEIVGLSGLDGQGQQQLLAELWRRRRSRNRRISVDGAMAFITGDRQSAGVFQLWSVGSNISVGSFRELSWAGILDRRKEARTTSGWVDKLRIRGTTRTPITDLSGGNQQKALVARALASSAKVILLDDPFRGVDIETRREVYRLMRQEADAGRSFLWFTTENSELEECDRVYVMSRGSVVSELRHDEINEEAVVAASFA